MYCDVRYIKQLSEYDCGIACLTAVARTWDVPVEVLEKNILESKNNKGTYLHELKSLSESIGLKSFQLLFKNTPKDDLIHHLKLGRPLICPLNLPVHRYGIWNILLLTKARNAVASCLVIKKNHYVVVFGYSNSKDRVLIMDPAHGCVTLSWKEFEGYWARNKHAVLLCSK